MNNNKVAGHIVAAILGITFGAMATDIGFLSVVVILVVLLGVIKWIT